MGTSAKHASDCTAHTDPAWAKLRFGPRPHVIAGRGWQQRLPLALASLAVHGLLIAALLQAAPRAPESGNSLAVSERVQLRFVSAHSVVQEQGARAAASNPAPSAAPAETTAQALLEKPLPVRKTAQLALPERVQQPSPALSPAISNSAAAPVAPSMSLAVSNSAAAPAAAADQPDVASTASAGRGQGVEGQGRAAQTSAPAQDSHGVADWSQAVMRQLARFRSYPASARAQRVEGVVLVHATIAADGKVLATRVRHSCGNPDLDAEALATFQRARRLPAPPAHLPSPLQVDLPVSFSLRG